LSIRLETGYQELCQLVDIYTQLLDIVLYILAIHSVIISDEFLCPCCLTYLLHNVTQTSLRYNG